MELCAFMACTASVPLFCTVANFMVATVIQAKCKYCSIDFECGSNSHSELVI